MIPAEHRLRVPGALRSPGGRAALDLLEHRFGSLDPSVALVYLLDHVHESALPALAWQFAVPALAWAAVDTAGRRQILKTIVARHRKRGTPGAVEQALQEMGHPGAWVQENTAIFYDGTIRHDGTFKYGADSHWACFWVVLVGDDPLVGPEAAVVDAWKNKRSHLRGFYWVPTVDDVADLAKYSLTPYDGYFDDGFDDYFE